MTMKPTQFLSVDCETTGLDPDRHSLLELAAIPLDDRLKNDVQPFHILIKPLPQRSIDPKAIEVNGHTWAVEGKGPEWESALDYAQAQIAFKKYIITHFGYDASFIILVGWNVSFDEGFLKRLYTYDNHGMQPGGSVLVPTEDVLKWPFHYHRMDVMAICRYLDIRAGRTRRSYRLEAMAKHYFTDEERAKTASHTALGDCLMQLQVLEAVEQDMEGHKS